MYRGHKLDLPIAPEFSQTICFERCSPNGFERVCPFWFGNHISKVFLKCFIQKMFPKVFPKNFPECNRKFKECSTKTCQMFPYLEVGVESISVAIFVIFVFVIFWSDIWLKTKILFWTTWWRPRLKPNVKCKIVSCVLLHGIQWTTLYYTICSRLLHWTTTLQCSNIMY